MTVAEAIEILSQLPDDYTVVISTKSEFAEPFKFVADGETQSVFVHAD
jgi:hypothetical protein